MAVEFKVLKYETVTRFCAQCGGVGHRFKKTASGTFKNPCPHCMDGKYTVEKRTEVTLLEALKEIGLIK